MGAYKPADVGSLFYWAENQSSTIGNPKYSKVKVDVIGDIAGNDRYDAATNMLGINWRLPTDVECLELLNRCKWEIKVIDGIEGRLVTGPNGNSIFLPFNQKNFISGKYVSGHYWTSTPHHGSESATDLRFGENCKQPAEIWSATASGCMFGIRPIYTTVTRAMLNMQKLQRQRKHITKFWKETLTLRTQNVIINTTRNNVLYAKMRRIRTEFLYWVTFALLKIKFLETSMASFIVWTGKDF